MSPEFLTALIGGGSGVASAFITAWLTNRGLSKAADRQDRKQAQYLAVKVGPVLRDLAASCLIVSRDDGSDEQGRPTGPGGTWEPQVYVDRFDPLGFEGVNWQSLAPALMVEVMTFEDKRRQVGEILGPIKEHDSPPEYADYFAARQLEYAQLGVYTIELGIRLFRGTGHTSALPGADDLRELLLERVTSLQQENLQYERRTATSNPY